VITQELLDSLEQHSQELSALECDGMSRVISHLLGQAGVEHIPMVGALRIDHSGQVDGITPHVWIEVPCHEQENQILDFRARYWLASWDPNLIPHGLLYASAFPWIRYLGKPVPGAGDDSWSGQMIYGILLKTGKPVSYKELFESSL